ncbi:hypothetical protein C2S52_023400 [Perilla frutescens var. hirtella]|uniref:Uncharacterized protein n=1 Tax=Perilla frutescens var. hirtella TaxID=608512 RepID=A0AAD4P0M6_PERFH|nr:hypothetical protein C2S51_038827 [Perilla frutescens var. frutescens]KAH6757532.1 hypothetical protein C2S52_023400 [Perilla frutescens var. hirtella]KAH6821712.1 hypothetical protein C2S53_015469 [Perilla frutescens var. hirtella]
MAMLLISAITLATAEEIDPKSLQRASFYDVLQSNGLPMGLFPSSISNFSVEAASGVFRLRLDSPSPCETVFETRLRYERDIGGRFSYGRIGNLTGVSAQELFLWLPVKGIQVDVPSSGLIYFDVEVVSKQFSLSLFETPKDCSVEDVDVEVEEDLLQILQRQNPSENLMKMHSISMDEEHRAAS